MSKKQKRVSSDDTIKTQATSRIDNLVKDIKYDNNSISGLTLVLVVWISQHQDWTWI